MYFRFLELFLYCFALCAAEPACSRFHYEEQTLKKIIMVEMLVESLKEETEGTKKTVNDALEDVRRDREELKRTFEDVQTSLSEEIKQIGKGQYYFYSYFYD